MEDDLGNISLKSDENFNEAVEDTNMDEQKGGGNGEGNAEDNGGLNLPENDGAAEKRDLAKKMVQGELYPGDFGNVKVFYNLKEA